MKALAAAVVIALAGATVTAQEPVYTLKDKDVKQPTLVVEKKPSYTADAMRKRIQGSVTLESVIDKAGNPTDIKIVKSLDKEFGLDDKAVEALKAWRFKPATKDGKAVPYHVTIEMTFTLRDRRVFDKTSAQVTPPVLVKEQKPSYTAEAMRSKVEGLVELEAVVGVDGRITEVRVLKGLAPGLDANAIAAMSQSTFTPAMLDGRPVPYRTTMQFTFTLRD